MMDDTISVTTHNVALEHCDDVCSEAAVKVETIQELIGDALWVVGPERVSSLYTAQTFDPDPCLSGGSNITVPLDAPHAPRSQLRALREQIVACGAATLDWDGIEQELRERRGDAEDR